MNQDVVRRLAKQLRDRRERIFLEVAEADADFRHLADERESEPADCAEEEQEASLLARFDDRAKEEIAAIDAALQRILIGSYGRCQQCDEVIAVERLIALPAAALCISCARDEEPAVQRPIA